MAGSKKAQKTIDVWKKKRWYKIIAPSLFNNEIVGETPSLEPNLLIGRTVEANLMVLTRDIKKQHINVIFEIDRIQGDSAFTHLKKYEVISAFIKKSVRRSRNRIDDSFVCKSIEGWNILIKPFILTRNSAKRAVKTIIRKRAKEFFVRTIARNTKEGVIKDIVFMKFQKYLKDMLDPIFPLKTCEVRVMEIISQGQPISKEELARIEKEEKEKRKSEAEKETEDNESIKIEVKQEKTEKPKEEETKKE